MPHQTFKRLLTSLLVSGSLIGAVAPMGLAQAPAGSTPTTTPPAAPPPLREQIEALWKEHQLWVAAIGIVSVALSGTYLGALWLRPLVLLKIPSTDIPTPWENIKLPLSRTRWLKYRDRVLDAWVNQHWQVAQTEFLKLATVENRTIHISLPVQLEKAIISDLNPTHLARTFAKNIAVLMICGEGGAGKTSLACQIAQWGLAKHLKPHRMIPVLVETELEDGVTLVAAIQGQLTALTDQAEPITLELLEKLLQRQRVLVIVDHLSEMGEATRSQIKPHLADFPANALVITSRLEEALGGARGTVVKPLQVEANRLWPFMSAYLEAQGQQDLFEDDEYADGCDRLRRMAGERSITVLLARMYIDQMIRERQGAGGIRSDSVPKLMLSYLNQLNRAIEPEAKRDDLDVQRDAKLIAWECLKHTYRPMWIKKGDAIAALDAVADDLPAKQRLHYLETRLQLLQAPEPGDSTRIILDPLAEYLAAAHLVERTCQSPDPATTWQQFFADVDHKVETENEPPEIIRGFLLAVRDYCLDNADETGIPSEIPDQLARKANVDPDKMKLAIQKYRVRRLIEDLSWPDSEVRQRAILEIEKIGSIARPAIPKLVDLIRNKQHVDDVSSALVSIGIESVLPLAKLLKSNDAEARLVSISILRRLGTLSKAAVPEISVALIEDESPEIRWNAAILLAKIGSKSKESLPSLIKALEDESLAVSNWAAFAIGRIGKEAAEAIPNLVSLLERRCTEDFSVFLAAGEALTRIGFRFDDLEMINESGEKKKIKEFKITVKTQKGLEDYHGELTNILREYRCKRKIEKEKREQSRPLNTKYVEWQRTLSADTPPQDEPLPPWL